MTPPAKRLPLGRIIQALVTLLVLGGIALSLADRAKDTCYREQNIVGEPYGALCVACSDPSAQVTVTDRIDGINGTTRCASGTEPMAYDMEPQRTRCATQPS